MKNISIFFDTNIIESRFSHDKMKLDFLFHHAIKPSGLFYEILDYVKRNGIENKVNYYIPSISWKEFKNHLIENYNTSIKCMDDLYSTYHKSFKNDLTLLYEYKYKNEEEYAKHLETLEQDFLEKNKCTIIDYPKDIIFFEELVNKCLNKLPPFKTARAAKKDYHDAGLKDALIFETIIRHQKEYDCICILVTHDNDYSDYKNVYVCKNIDDFNKCLEKLNYVVNIDSIKHKIENSDYLKEQIIISTENLYDESVTDFNVIEVTKIEESIYKVRIKTTINEAIYDITCKYDVPYNDFIEIQSLINND